MNKIETNRNKSKQIETNILKNDSDTESSEDELYVFQSYTKELDLPEMGK